jgi:hypothetical protein
MLPICHHGCGIWSYVDCSRRSSPVLSFDVADGWRLESPSLAEWFKEWLDESPGRRVDLLWSPLS